MMNRFSYTACILVITHSVSNCFFVSHHYLQDLFFLDDPVCYHKHLSSDTVGSHCCSESSHNVSHVCVLQRHDECVDKEPTECTCGPLRDHILPPWAIYPVIKVQNYPHAHVAQTVLVTPTQNISPGLFFIACTTVLPVWLFSSYQVQILFVILNRQDKYHTFPGLFILSLCFSP